MKQILKHPMFILMVSLLFTSLIPLAWHTLKKRSHSQKTIQMIDNEITDRLRYLNDNIDFELLRMAETGQFYINQADRNSGLGYRYDELGNLTLIELVERLISLEKKSQTNELHSALKAIRNLERNLQIFIQNNPDALAEYMADYKTAKTAKTGKTAETIRRPPTRLRITADDDEKITGTIVDYCETNTAPAIVGYIYQDDGSIMIGSHLRVNVLNEIKILNLSRWNYPFGEAQKH